MAELNSSAPTERRQSRRSQQRKTAGGQVTLEKVLGITTVSSSGLTSDPNTGLIAYPAGSVVVLLQPKGNQQNHILNGSRKPFTAVAFSHDGKHLATGESGHRPCVRVWEVGGSQVAEVQSHKHGVSCVAFSSNGAYIVSVGYQHDMTVSVWDWRKGSIVASNKVSSRVLSVSFSQDSSYFVTAGNRHVKFWYLDASRDQRVFSTVPLIGRSGLLNDHKTSVFCGVACGRGLTASNTYCVTSSGLLCLFNRLRHLEAWVDLKTSSASCLAVSEDFVFCGCADGVIRVFSPTRLQYLTTLQRPHLLGAEQGLPAAGPDAQHPPTLALTLDPRSRMLTCVYGDHSIYVWDVHDLGNVGKIYSARYHSGCVWNLEVYPELPDPSRAHLEASSFLSCSSDHTVRFWNTEVSSSHRNLRGDDLPSILYVGGDTQEGEGEAADGKAGVRVLAVSPDGQQLAAGDRRGDVRVFGLQFLDQLVKIEAHDSEVVCLEFSPASTGVRLLASAGRDRLVHIFDQNYNLLQTLNDHSAPISAIRFTGESPEIHMVTCSVDKSINFQTAEQTGAGPEFSRRHCVVEKTSLYDMDCSGSQVLVACQDRNVRVYGVDSGKMRRCLKGSGSDKGSLLKVRMDPSGSLFATSCSNKNIDVFDLETGECVASMFGHSETVTSLRFSPDCRRLFSASGDSCIFVWRLDDHMTNTMRRKLPLRPAHRRPGIRRETFIMAPAALLPPAEEEEETERRTPVRLDTADGIGTNSSINRYTPGYYPACTTLAGLLLGSLNQNLRTRTSRLLTRLHTEHVQTEDVHLQVSVRPPRGAAELTDSLSLQNSSTAPLTLVRSKNSPVPDRNVFSDGMTRVDFVLVWEEPRCSNEDNSAVDPAHMKWREEFLRRLEGVGLLQERREVLQMKKKVCFVLLSAPWDVLCFYAEEISLRVPLQVNWSSKPSYRRRRPIADGVRSQTASDRRRRPIADGVLSQTASDCRRGPIADGVRLQTGSYRRRRPIADGVRSQTASDRRRRPIADGVLSQTASYRRRRPIADGVRSQTASYRRRRPIADGVRSQTASDRRRRPIADSVLSQAASDRRRRPIADGVLSQTASDHRRRPITDGVLSQTASYRRRRPIADGVRSQTASYRRRRPIADGVRSQTASYRRRRPIADGVRSQTASYRRRRPITGGVLSQTASDRRPITDGVRSQTPSDCRRRPITDGVLSQTPSYH
ncbi:Mitogen-activated protein kinase-binding protein 1 [Oryzias melastigma]|uniref:Mitogen-activated protein kinase-binding protein 1 n=1 Tax=Oryzias melastigma TaxID=30732 RepID=A0A834FLJ7_ORYME|nr:Mitogen-activated protein kinase-binding protein 1 [Oryzias melastigma]